MTTTIGSTKKLRTMDVEEEEETQEQLVDQTALSFAFASISTDDFKFNTQTATKILSEKVEEFLKISPDDIKLVLVDPMFQLQHSSLPKALKVAEKGTDLLSQGCSVVAVGCNKLFKLGGDRLNIALHKAFGTANELHDLIQQVYPREVPEIGKAYLVKVPEAHPLHQTKGLKFVVNILGPNMNPNRLDYLDGDYELGEKLLEKSYDAMFLSFSQLLKNKNSAASGLTQKLKVEVQEEATRSNTPDVKVMLSDIPPYDPFPVTSQPPALPGLSLRPFLSGNVKPPYRRLLWFNAFDNVVIYDGYPKAQYHLLVVPTKRQVNAVTELRPSDLEMVRTMHYIGKHIASKFQATFQLGYHALPSLTPLHLHVISTDLNSARLNTKKHWNSFAHRDLFIKADDVEEQISRGLTVSVKDSEELHQLENSTPKCYKCGLAPTGTLKEILSTLKVHKCQGN
jgi:aprataxin